MDRRSWLWRRKSSEKSPGETESSGSPSSHSERFSDDQEVLQASPNSASLLQSPEDFTNNDGGGVHETVKILTEKLSAALLNISTKDALVTQHAKVAEEAVSGWEKAESEVAALKQQLEVLIHKNSALEDRIGHLDGALKECVRELRQAREEQEEKIHEALSRKTLDFESQKFYLENQLMVLRLQVEAVKSEASITAEHDVHSKLEACRKEVTAHKVRLLSLNEDLQMRTLERDLSVQAAETASKQHLESIKKAARLEAECRKLRSVLRKSSPASEDLRMTGSACSESLTDNYSDNEQSCSDSWASALIVELGQFRNDKVSTRSLPSSAEAGLMDDFLEMERLAALPHPENGRPSSLLDARTMVEPLNLRNERPEPVDHRIAELEAKVEGAERQNAELETALIGACKQLEASSSQLLEAEGKLVEIKRQLDLAEKSNQLATGREAELETKKKMLELRLDESQREVSSFGEKLELEMSLAADFSAKAEHEEVKRKAVESRLDSMRSEAVELHKRIVALESEVLEAKTSSLRDAAHLEDVEAARMNLESRFESVQREHDELHDKVRLLQGEVEKERALVADLADKATAMEAVRRSLDSQLESSSLEVRTLQGKLVFLEGKVEEERASSALWATKCRNLEIELLKWMREIELRRPMCSNGELKLKQEEELAAAAEKLAECQRTIASLNRHLKLLAAFDELPPDDEKPELDGDEVRLYDPVGPAGASPLPNGRKVGPPLPSLASSSSSTLYKLAKMMASRGRSDDQTEAAIEREGVGNNAN